MKTDTASWYTAADDPEPAEFGPVRGLEVTGRGTGSRPGDHPPGALGEPGDRPLGRHVPNANPQYGR